MIITHIFIFISMSSNTLSHNSNSINNRMYSVSDCDLNITNDIDENNIDVPNTKYVKYSINTPPIFTNDINTINNSDSKDEYSYDNSIYRINDNKLIKIYVRRENGKTEYININNSINKTIHDLKQEIQIKYGYPVQTQKIEFNNIEYGCNYKLKDIKIINGTMIYLKLQNNINNWNDNFTIEYNAYIELNSYVSHLNNNINKEEDIDSDHNNSDDDDNDYWSIRIDEWSIHSQSDNFSNDKQMIGIVCYQYDGKVEWNLNGIKCKSGDIIIKNIISLKYCQYNTMYKYIFGCELNNKFVGNGFKINKYGKIKMFSNQINKIGQIEMFWLNIILKNYKEKNIKNYDIEKYQKKYSRYRYNIDKFDCQLCGIDQYIYKEQNNYKLLTENHHLL
eukprot:203877_1